MTQYYTNRKIESHGTSTTCYYRHFDGLKYWNEYYSSGKLLCRKNAYGDEIWYDESGNQTQDPIKILLLSQKLHSEVSK